MTPEEKKQFDDHVNDFVNHKHRGYDKTPRLDISYRYIIWRVLDSSTSQGIISTIGGDLELPLIGVIINVGAFEDTAGITGTGTIDVNLNGTTIMSSAKLVFDSTEKTTRTSATPPILTTTNFSVGDILTVDIDSIQTTPAKGLTIVLTIL